MLTPTENAIPNGLYKMAFETRSGTDFGTAYLMDGKLRGGDGGMAYVGCYRTEGPLFSAEISVTQHRHVPGAVNALGLSNVFVNLTGVVESESCVVRVQGSSPESGAVRFAARLSLIAD